MKTKYKTIFLSDIHLGNIGCKAEFLLKFLKETEADIYYLVGDIIDGWRIKVNSFGPSHILMLLEDCLK